MTDRVLDCTCRCGAVKLRVAVPRRSSGTRAKCYCTDCQTAAQALGAADLLDPAGGTEVWQTTPDLLEIVQGAEHLVILRLSPKGLFRWYAACCDTPLCNTLPRLGLPFVSIVLPPGTADDVVLGPVGAHVNTIGAQPGQGAPARDVNFAAAGMTVLWRMAISALSGRAGKNPLRTPGGDPIAPIRVLTLAERNAAKPDPRATT